MLTEDAQVLAETIIQIGEITANLRSEANSDKYKINELEAEKREWIDKAKKLIRDNEENQKDRKALMETISGLKLDTHHYLAVCEIGIKYINHRKKLTQREKKIRAYFELAIRGRAKTKDQCLDPAENQKDWATYMRNVTNFAKAE